jgi:hypothetical protein
MAGAIATGRDDGEEHDRSETMKAHAEHCARVRGTNVVRVWPHSPGVGSGVLRTIGEREIFPVGLGAMNLSLASAPSERDAIRVIHAALDAGREMIDTEDLHHFLISTRRMRTRSDTTSV